VRLRTVRRQGDLARIGARSISGDWLGVNAVMRLLKQAAHLPDASIDENAPSRGVSEGVVDFGRLVAKSAKAAIGSVGRKVRTSPVFASLFEGECRKRRKRSRHCRCQTATDQGTHASSGSAGWGFPLLFSRSLIPRFAPLTPPKIRADCPYQAWP
jgi:hypothetical protein